MSIPAGPYMKWRSRSATRCSGGVGLHKHPEGCSACSPLPRRWGTRGAAGPSPGREDAARARSHILSRILDGSSTAREPVAPRASRSRPSQVLQLKSKIEQAMWTSARESNFKPPSTYRRDRVGSTAWSSSRRSTTFNSLLDVHAGPTPKSSRPRSSTSPSAARNLTTTPRRSRRSGSRRTTRCARSPSR